MKKRLFQSVAHTLLLSFAYQLVFPACAWALTTGPSQPEVQSFEPVGTTEMVDMFSGDFNYNIPLLDVEGYPVNIFYHSGVGMEQEASWVGLGWNINPGEINRTVRGLPDDFNGDTIEKFTHIKEEHEYRVGAGANFSTEVFGKDIAPKKGISDSAKFTISLGGSVYVAQSNYRGMSAGIKNNIGFSMPGASVGIGMGVGSQSGADVDLNASASTSTKITKGSIGIAASGATGFNSRTGLKEISLGVNPSMSQTVKPKTETERRAGFSGRMGTGLSASIPIGIQNYVPVITNKVNQTGFSAQLKGGWEMMGGNISPYFDVSISNISYDEKGSRAGYGYLYSENADKNGIHDFSRDKDGMYNTTMKNLPAASLAYDVYTVNGQGTGGMFRPYRNDIGSIHDPYVSDNPASEQNSVLLEFGIGNLFEVGSDLTQVYTANKSGPWDDHQVAFSKDLPGTLYEKVFFKNGGELTYNQQQDVTQLFNTVPQFLAEDMSSIRGGSSGALPNTYSRTASPARLLWDNSTLDRSSRATHISFRTARQAMTVPKAEQDADVISYENGSGGKYYDPKLKRYKRYSKNPLFGYAQSYRQDLLSEFTQTMADGRRYIYDIPAMNNVSREVSFAADESRANLNSGYVGFNRGVDDNVSNRKGRDNFYSTTNTPAHAHSFLLSTVLSADYVDVMGDGPTDDDPGAFTKFNYTLSDSDYRWRTPYHKDSAQFDPGYWSDGRDGKGNYLIGSRQQWYLRSIESKNYIAEFYVSKRKDARGVRDSILASTSNIRHKSIDLTKTKTDSSFSYQLDSIKLFNKHDRYINKENAVAVKTVILQYDYSLCPGVPNNVTGGGKLTLKKLFIRYGNSQKNLLSPYVFDYGNTATGVSNLAYNFSAKDRWGNYKAVNAQLPNFEYPYTDQPVNGTDKAAQDKMLSSWNLTDIKLPSGGKIHMDYESDDYGYVQDKRAMQMIRIEGAGASPNLDRRNTLYQGLNDINDYVYFKRRKDQERPGLSLKDNYLEDQDLIYYNFNLDITGTGKEEYVKGYARFDEINVCPDNSDYAYIKLRRDNAGNLKLHPATIYGINMAKYYLPHLFYPGYSETASGGGVWKGLIGAAGELVSTLVMENPFKRFIRQHKAKYFKPSNSWLRLQSPSLAKQGGGIRVKQLTLTDSWNTLSGNDAASYGKKYDYTIADRRYGKISSGVASYEPMIGGDENPFRRPVPYTAEGGRLLPSTDFFQEEPFGESFFPGASVGYSSVKVTSIHQAYSRSSQAMDEYLFYTAKDHPVRVEYTEKTGPGEIRERDLRKLYMEERVLQGYAIVLNDMHGKAKAVNNYVIHDDGSNSRPEQITGVQYFYKTDGNKRLDNTATAFVRKRGTTNTYELKNIKLGMDVDFTVDSRQRKTQTSTSTTSLNLNVFQVGIIPLFPFTLFNSETDDTRVFRSLVSTKIVQQYGLLAATEQFDHGAITRMESLVYDAETGGVLLSRTSNKYGDYQYQRTDPAYLAYEGMRPAYTNAGYTETVDSIVVNDYRDGFLFTDNLDRFTAGDELLVELPASGMADHADGVNLNRKLWVTGKGLDTAAGEDKSRKTESPEDPVIPEPVDDSGFVVFGRTNDTCLFTGSYITINIHAAAAGLPLITSGSIIAPFPSSSGFSCGTPGCYTLKLRPGTYVYVVSFKSSTGGTIHVRPAPFTVTAGSCTKIGVAPCGSMAPFLIVPTPTGGKRCALKVAPRFKDKFAPGTTSPNLSGWPTSRTVYKNVKVTVMRSGRRNNLDQSVQQTAFAQPASTSPVYSSLATLMGKNDNLLSVAANTFTDTALITHPYNDTLKIPGDYDYGGFNPYVLGTRGTYRPLATYVPFTGRSYSKNHERFDGTFTLTNYFWNFVNSAGMPLSTCDAKTDVLQPNSLAGSLFWKRASLVTRYDVFGNELEELDPVGNYTSAQYGYNNGLPQAVASNVQAQYFMFDGFEEYHSLVPRALYQLYKRNEQHSPFARLLGGIFSDLSATYPSENLAAGSRPEFNRNGQNYYLRNTAAGGALGCTQDASHTGLYSMKVTGATDIRFEVRPPQTNVSSFRMAYGKQYVLNLWARSTTPGAAISSGQFQTKVHTGWISDMTIKTGSIDGWYLLEAGIDLRSIFVPSYVFLKLPAGVYVDDIRLMPVESNMKSFVYDPLTYRLAAQLDENHFAAFYEYDQEGLLIRTKKETEKGIITITESRRANTKN